MALTKDDDLVYLFTGTSEVFIKNRMNRIIQGYNKQKYTIIKYDMETTPISTILNDAITVPLLEDLKIIILKNPLLLSKEKEEFSADTKEFIKYVKNPSESTVLMIDATNIKLNASNEVYKQLKNFSYIIHYDDSQEIELKGWLIRTLAMHHIEIKEEALNLFMLYLNNNQIRMEQEIEKLISYVGQGEQITANDVKLLVDKDLSNEIFNLIRAIVDHNRPQVASIYQNLIQNTKDTMAILSMVNATFVDLLSVAKLLKVGHSQNDIAKFYGISPGRAYYMVKNAKSFQMEDLENYIKKMSLLDYKIKSGQIDRNLGLDLLILQF